MLSAVGGVGELVGMRGEGANWFRSKGSQVWVSHSLASSKVPIPQVPIRKVPKPPIRLCTCYTPHRCAMMSRSTSLRNESANSGIAWARLSGALFFFFR